MKVKLWALPVIYIFHNDTLVGVFRGIKNVMLKKPIDYNKHAGSQPE